MVFLPFETFFRKMFSYLFSKNDFPIHFPKMIFHFFSVTFRNFSKIFLSVKYIMYYIMNSPFIHLSAHLSNSAELSVDVGIPIRKQ